MIGGGGMGLERPQILWALVPLVLFALLRVLYDRKYALLLAPIALRYRLSRLLFWIFIVCILLALAGPYWGERQIVEYRRGLDVVLALDLSRSMEVRDGAQAMGRLEQAAAIGRDVVERAGDIRFGTAFGKGRGTLALPLTEDYAAIHSFLESLHDTVYAGRGTNLESIVDAASSAFLDNFPSRRVIVLFSDGEELSGSLAAAVERARRADISIIAVGVGTAAGGPVPGFFDGDEQPISHLQRPALEDAAERTGGIYVDGADAGPRIRAFLESLSLDSRAAGLGRETSGPHRERRPRWRLFLIAGLAALGLSKICMRRKRKHPPAQRLPRAAVLLLSPFFLLYQSCAPVSGKLLVVEGNFYHSQSRYDEAIQAYSKALEYPEALPYAEYGMGTVYASLEENSAALGRYDAALESLGDFPQKGREELGYRINYNRGIVLFWDGNFEGAAEAFREALEIDGSRSEAKRNLELSLLSFSREQTRIRNREKEEEQGERRDDRLATLFQYLNLKEQNQWKSREWEEDPALLGPDY
jgi:Ca-activated chloride channel family protein